MTRKGAESAADESLEGAGNEPIEGPHEVRQTPLELLPDFEWHECDVDDPTDVRFFLDLLFSGRMADAGAFRSRTCTSC